MRHMGGLFAGFGLLDFCLVFMSQSIVDATQNSVIKALYLWIYVYT